MINLTKSHSYPFRELSELIDSIIHDITFLNQTSHSKLDHILYLADFLPLDIAKLINKFHAINTLIAANGGTPVLKAIQRQISN